MKELIYKIVDFFTFGKGLTKSFHGYKLRLPTRYINYFPANYETENFDFVKSSVKPGSIVFDIGAHMGFFANITAQITGSMGKVYAFEPTPSTFEMLQQMCSANKNNQTIVPVNAAVGKEEGVVTFYISNDKIDNTNSALGYRNAATHKPIDIPLTSIDTFVQKNNIARLDFIKIDVEGFEYDAVLGGLTTFKTLKPKVILAIHPKIIAEKGDRLEDIYDTVLACNFSILYNGQPISRDIFCSNTDMIDLHLIPA
jgi:FkbM family methyltransferase